MEKHDLELAEAVSKAAEHFPTGQGRGAGVQAYDDFAEALERELAAMGLQIEHVGRPAPAHSAGD